MSSSKTQNFNLKEILTLTTGVMLLEPDESMGAYDLLDFMWHGPQYGSITSDVTKKAAENLIKQNNKIKYATQEFNEAANKIWKQNGKNTEKIKELKTVYKKIENKYGKSFEIHSL